MGSPRIDWDYVILFLALFILGALLGFMGRLLFIHETL